MPVGVIVDALSILLGGIVGAALANFISDELKDNLPSVFGVGAILIAITLLVEVHSITVAIICLIVGAIIGELINMDGNVRRIIHRFLPNHQREENRIEILITLVVLFCFSGTGIFGAINEGFTGDSSILVAKSVLDFFTAVIFGATVGYSVAVLAIPQFILNGFLFIVAGLIVPHVNMLYLGDFKAVGGMVALAAAFKLLNVGNLKVVNLVPSIILVVLFCIVA